MKPYRRLQNRQVIKPRRNKHHLMWSGWLYKTKLEREFRNLGCVHIKIDTLVHGYVHYLYRDPIKARARVMHHIIGRHRNRLCGCFNADQRVSLNLLTFKRRGELPKELRSLETLPCLNIFVDRAVYSLMKKTYRRQRELKASDLRRLLDRHYHEMTCGCFNTQVSQDQIYRRLSIAA